MVKTCLRQRREAQQAGILELIKLNGLWMLFAFHADLVHEFLFECGQAWHGAAFLNANLAIGKALSVGTFDLARDVRVSLFRWTADAFSLVPKFKPVQLASLVDH